MRTSSFVRWLFALSLSIAGCGSSHPHPVVAAAAGGSGNGMAMGGGSGGDMDRCPMRVAGTEVAVADTQGGVAITFTTTGDVADLRRRVHDMAAMHEQMMSGHAHGGMASDSGDHDMGRMGTGEQMMMPPSHAAAEDADGGARVTLTPDDPAQLDAVRAAARHHADMMKAGDCPMMHHAGAAAGSGTIQDREQDSH